MTRRITTKSERLVAWYQLCNQVTRQPCLPQSRYAVAGDVIDIAVFRNRDD